MLSNLICQNSIVMEPDSNPIKVEKNPTPCEITMYRQFLELSASLETVTIASNSCNDVPLVKMEYLPYLTDLMIGDYCFQDTFVFIIDNLRNLRKLMIGDHSFTHLHDLELIKSTPSLCDSKMFVTHCKQLQEISIGAFSFADHEIMVLSGITIIYGSRKIFLH